MNKHQFNSWLMEDYKIEAHAWFNNRTEAEKKAIKGKWYAGLKEFQIGYLLKAGEAILSSDEEKPKYPDEHLQTLIYKCRKFTPIPDVIPIFKKPDEEEKAKLKETTKKCRQIVRQLKISKMVGEDGPGDKNSGNGSTESPLGDSPTEAKFEAQIATTPEEGEKSVDWDKMAREVAQLAETPDIPF